MKEIIDEFIKESSLSECRKRIKDLYYVFSRILKIYGSAYRFGDYRAYHLEKKIYFNKFTKNKKGKVLNEYGFGSYYAPGIYEDGSCRSESIENIMEIYDYVQNNLEQMLEELLAPMDYATSFAELSIPVGF